MRDGDSRDRGGQLPERRRQDTDDLKRVMATSQRLRELLASPAYSRRWQGVGARNAGRKLHQGAIATILARYLWESGEVADTDTDLPRRLKDVVSRALNGKLLTPATLRWFIEAFSLAPNDASDLWALRAGTHRGGLVVVRHDLSAAAVPATPPIYQTVALHEFHRLGPDGLPQEHRTVHVIRAVNEVLRYPYLFDTDAVAIDVVRGGTATPVRRSELPGLFAVDIVLTRPLRPGETASMEYRTLFSYRVAPPPEFRRAARRRIDNVEIHVTFHGDRLPERLWWAVWEDYREREPTHREDAVLDPDGSVHRYIDTLEAHAVGFVWRFPRRRRP